MLSAVPDADAVHGIAILEVKRPWSVEDPDATRKRYYDDYGPHGLRLFEKRFAAAEGTGEATREIFEWDHDDVRVSNDALDGLQAMPFDVQTSHCGKAARVLLDEIVTPLTWVVVDDIRDWTLRKGEATVPIDPNCGTVVEQTIVKNPETGQTMEHYISIVDHVSAHAALTGR